MTLSEFLLARIAEVEAVAREATTGPWEAWADGSVMAPEAAGNYEVARAKAWNLPHIARNNPAHVLADCGAKRRIVELRESETIWGPSVNAMDAALRTLALPYADHPDYRDEWRP